ncbi:hypothetical protein PMIN02_009515 [Paraphaeosphaeria minitans]|uniref:Uncharacterized protein n=1 Tax=Paraphaeosphaeria minitans TaxID=565426 RepID=A0A9P6G9Q1_9PLEO|nr:hypothetical protein PMIN01_11284 [Paraphaeosphaeria minitans]
MPSWKNLLKRHSIPISEAPIDEERCKDPNEFHLPTNPKDVKLQESEPQSLPSAEDSEHAVRFFLYHVLTFRGNKVAKRWPQWVLETVSYWNGDGRALRALEGDLTHLCPMSAGYAQLDYKVAPESGPSGDCRTHIGLVLSGKIRKLKENESRRAKAQEEWRATRRGCLPWNHSLIDIPGSASNHSPSQFRRQESVTSRYSCARPSDTMPDLLSMYRAHTAFTPLSGHHAPSIAASQHEITRARSTIPLRRQFSSVMAYSSSTESQRASRDCSASTHTTDGTSLQQSPKSVVKDTGKQLPVTHPILSHGFLYPDEDLFDAVSSVRSYIAPSHHSGIRSTRSQKPQTNLQEAHVETEMNGATTSHSTSGSKHERSTSVSSYGNSTYPVSEQPYPRYPSSPSRYRSGVLQTVGTLPSLPFGMNVPHRRISSPRDGRSSGAFSYSLASSQIGNARQPGLVSEQDLAPRYGSVPPQLPSHYSHTPSLINFAQNVRQTPSRLSDTQSIHQIPTPRRYIPTVEVFAGPYRSTNTASLDIETLEDGGKFILEGLKKQRHGVSSQSRRRPVYVPPKPADNDLVVEPSTRIVNPHTGRPFMTLYERIEDLKRI